MKIDTILKLNNELALALNAFIADMEGRFGEIPNDCDAYHLAKTAIFHLNDEMILAKLKKLSDDEIKVFLNSADGDDNGALVDALFASYPDYPISVFDENDPDQSTAKSIMLLGSWCVERTMGLR